MQRSVSAMASEAYCGRLRWRSLAGLSISATAVLAARLACVFRVGFLMAFVSFLGSAGTPSHAGAAEGRDNG